SWPIGAVESCPEPNVPNHEPAPVVWDCQAALSVWLSTATAAFDERFPGHAAYVRVTLHDEWTVTDAGGNQVLLTRSGGSPRVVVFELADGSVHALGIGHLGVETEHLNV